MVYRTLKENNIIQKIYIYVIMTAIIIQLGLEKSR